MNHQDSSHDTGVSAENTYATSPLVARNRKAAAALQMKLAGATWPEICRGVGYPTPRSAQVAVEKALVKELHDADDKDKLRKLAGARLERLLRSGWSKAISPDHPEHLVAMSKCREMIADYRKLFGLDAPTEVIVHNPTTAELDAWVASVLALQSAPVEEYDIFEGEVVEDDEPRALPS